RGSATSSFSRTNLFQDVMHRNCQEAPGAARRIEYVVFWPRIQHENSHAADVARREELATVPAQVGAYDLLVSLALHVGLALQQGIWLELRDEIGQHARI